MENYKTFAEMEAILLTAIELPGRSIKDISAATGIKVSTLYKWKTTKAHLSPLKADIGVLEIPVNHLSYIKQPAAFETAGFCYSYFLLT